MVKNGKFNVGRPLPDNVRPHPYKYCMIQIEHNERNFKEKIIQVCNNKIESKGPEVGLSFYAFFANKNGNPELLMEAAKWWIMTNKLDPFEKAITLSTTRPCFRVLRSAASQRSGGNLSSDSVERPTSAA